MLKTETKIIEKCSSLMILMIAMSIIKANVLFHHNIMDYIPATLLTTIAVSQFFSMCFNKAILRIIMSWVAAIFWSWFAFATLNTIVSIISICMGALNIYIFMHLANQLNFDWLQFLNE
jgi:hypothetical protein